MSLNLEQTDLPAVFEPELEATLKRVAGMSPKALMDVADDPRALTAHARVMLMAQLGVMHKRSASPNFSDSHRLQLIDKLIRASGLNVQTEDAVSADKLPQIVINVGDPTAKITQNRENGPPQPVFPAKYLKQDVKNANQGAVEDEDDEYEGF